MAKPPSMRIFLSSAVDAREEVEDKIDQTFLYLQKLITEVSEKEAQNALNEAVCKNAQAHEDITMGFLVGILTDPLNAPRYYRDLTLVTRDGLQLFILQITGIIIERLPRVQDGARAQTFWLLRELVSNSVPSVDTVCFNMLRQVAGGDVSPKNISLAENLLDIFVEFSSWLEKYPILLATVVYSYLRLIEDHGAPMLAQLRQREVEFVIRLLREKFQECSVIGRDLVRLLQNVARIPEFEAFWRDLLDNPTSLSPTLQGGVAQLLGQRTSRRFLQCRLTPEMEKKIHFLTSQVKFGQQKRYQDWFQKCYLSTPESQSLRCDLIRFICGVIHPTNEVLCSDILPRWALIGWLLGTCMTNAAASNAKLALFYDWLLFDVEKDSIMNIEPGALVMNFSIKPAPQITATLLDFLCRIMTQFSRPLADKVRQGIHTSLRQIQEKRVLSSLSSLFDSSKLDKELRAMLREHFAEFCDTSDVEPLPPATPPAVPPVHPLTTPPTLNSIQGRPDEESVRYNNPSPVPPNQASVEAQFSEDEDDTSLFRPIVAAPKTTTIASVPLPDITDRLEQLNDGLKQPILWLQDKGRENTESACEMMERLMQEILSDESFDEDSAKDVGVCLAVVLQNEFSRKLPPPLMDKDSLEDSIGTPLFVLLRNYCQTPSGDLSRRAQLLILAEMSRHQPKLGALMLYHMRISKLLEQDVDAEAYKDFAHARASKTVVAQVLHDLQLLEREMEFRLFSFLVPEIYNCFESVVRGHIEIIHEVVAVIDGKQLQELVCLVLRGELKMFSQETFSNLLMASVQWETFEQMALWHLIDAHSVSLEWFSTFLGQVSFVEHDEACMGLLLLLKSHKPTVDLLQVLISREVKPKDLFVVSLLLHWSRLYEDVLAEHLSTLLIPQKGNKRKRQTKNQAAQSTQQCLAHLDQLRQHSKVMTFFSIEPLQSALQHIQSGSAESQKTRYSDLFALAYDSEEDVPPTKSSSSVSAGTSSRAAAAAASSSNNKMVRSSARSGGSSSGSKKSTASGAKSSGGSSKGSNSATSSARSAPTIVDDSDTEMDSSTEEETTKPKPPRKKRKHAVVSDSD